MIYPNLIFVVDDSADYRFLVQAIFKRFMPTYELRFFAGGNELNAHILASTQLPSLLLLDRHMPERDGHQTLQLIKQHPYWQLVPVVMCSADASGEEMEGCYRAGANSFVRKPIAFEALKQLLISTVHYWLEFNQVNRTAQS